MFLIITFFSKSTDSNEQNSMDYVPNKETAKKIAEAIWIPIYGEKVTKFKPYKAYLVDDDTVWLLKEHLKKV